MQNNHFEVQYIILLLLRKILLVQSVQCTM